MRKAIFLAFILSIFILGGCTTGTAVRGQICTKSMEQGNVFEELKDSNTIPGWSVLIIRASIKTLREGYYLFESKNSLHGKPEYPFIFNIGGQGVTWMAKGNPDTQKRTVDAERNPEGGEGVKYLLEKRIKLKPGSYKICLGLTEENVQKEIDINLLEGKTSILEFNPVYQRDRISGYTFYKGIHDFKVYLNEKEIDPL
jgi:hypothetical protein